MGENGVQWPDYISAIAAGGAVAAVIAIPATSYFRRPALSIAEDKEGIQSAVESDQCPWIRLLVRNKGWRRSAKDTQVVLDHYRATSGGKRIPMGSPTLRWPSTTKEEGLVVFPGGERPVDFGRLFRKNVKVEEEIAVLGTDQKVSTSITTQRWYLELQIGFPHPGDGRHCLAPVPDGYIVQLTVGADEGSAKTFEVHVNWTQEGPPPEAALESVSLEVIRAHRTLRWRR